MVDNRLLQIYIIAVIFLTIIPFELKADIDNYTVRGGDTLSHIVEKFTEPPSTLYGKSGRLERIKKINSITDSDLIFSGDIIIFSRGKTVGSEQPALGEQTKESKDLARSVAFSLTDEKQLKVVVSARTSIKRIDSTEAGAIISLLSTSGYGFDMTMEYLLEKNTSAFVDISYVSHDFIAGGNMQIENEKGAVSSFKLGGEIDKGGYSFGAQIGQNSEVSVVSASPTSVKIENVSIYSLSLFASKKIYNFKKVNIIPKLTLGTLQFGKTASSKDASGYLGEFSFELAYKNNWGEVNSSIFYSYKSIKQDILADKAKEIGVKVSIGKRF